MLSRTFLALGVVFLAATGSIVVAAGSTEESELQRLLDTTTSPENPTSSSRPLLERLSFITALQSKKGKLPVLTEMERQNESKAQTMAHERLKAGGKIKVTDLPYFTKPSDLKRLKPEAFDVHGAEDYLTVIRYLEGEKSKGEKKKPKLKMEDLEGIKEAIDEHHKKLSADGYTILNNKFLPDTGTLIGEAPEMEPCELDAIVKEAKRSAVNRRWRTLKDMLVRSPT